jgi:hypothetical protein
MTKSNPSPGNNTGMSSADIESVNAALWRIVELCAAGKVVLGHALGHLEDTPEGKGLSGILGGIEALADGANLKLIQVM